MQCHVLIFVYERVEWVGGINKNKKSSVVSFFPLFFSRSTIVEPEQKIEKNLAEEFS